MNVTNILGRRTQLAVQRAAHTLRPGLLFRLAIRYVRHVVRTDENVRWAWHSTLQKCALGGGAACNGRDAHKVAANMMREVFAVEMWDDDRFRRALKTDQWQ